MLLKSALSVSMLARLTSDSDCFGPEAFIFLTKNKFNFDLTPLMVS